MSLTASAHSVPGTFQQHVLIDGRHELVTDEPVRLGGEGSGPAPHELLPAALASCIATTVAAYARTKRWDLGDIAVDVEYDNKAVPRRFDVDIRFGARLDDEQLARLTKVAQACPLRRSLEVGFEFHERLLVGTAPSACRKAAAAPLPRTHDQLRSSGVPKRTAVTFGRQP